MDIYFTLTLNKIIIPHLFTLGHVIAALRDVHDKVEASPISHWLWIHIYEKESLHRKYPVTGDTVGA